MCFVWISEQTAIISLYSINWLVCITETECVYCAVRTGSLNGEPFLQGCDAISLCNRSLKMRAFPSTTPSRDNRSDWHHNPSAVSAPNTPRLCVTQTALQSVLVSDSLQNKPSQLKAYHSPLSSAEVSNGWIHSSTPPYACLRWRLINLLAPELFFLILAHSVYKMWIIQEPNTLGLWNKLHFEEEKKTESIYHV